jgi:multidrug efflux system membrane fusion protein
MNSRRLIPFGCLCLTLAMLTIGCGRNGSQVAPPETPVVPVSQPVQRQVTDYVEYTGRTEAVEAVDIRARVTGYLDKVYFKEGAEVKKGDLLFLIDPRPYHAQFDQAKSQISLNEASLKLARTTYERDRAVAAAVPGGVSQQQLDQDLAAVDEALARVRASQESSKIYQLNFDFSRVISPITGQVSRYYLTQGNLINQDQTLLTTVVSLDPMYVYFDLDEPTLLRVRRLVNEGKIRRALDNQLAQITAGQSMSYLTPDASALPRALVGLRLASLYGLPVSMALQGDRGFPHQGYIDFVNNQVNPTTGSISVRGVFPNPKPPNGVRLLSPGMFVRIRLPIGQARRALLIVDKAIQSDQGLKYVYVVDAHNKAQYRRVATGALQDDGLRVILEARFKLTDRSLTARGKAGLPDDVREKLGTLKNTELGREDFMARLGKLLTPEERERYQSQIINHTIVEGLNPDDWVVVGGVQQVRPRMEVQPDRIPMPLSGGQADDEAAPAADKPGS